MSVPAHRAENSPEHPPFQAGVNAPLDPVARAAAALGAGNLGDRESRVYGLLVLSYPDAEVDIPTLANLLPLTEQQIGNTLGTLASYGLVSKRMRVIGYKDGGIRIRRYVYRVVGDVR